MFSTNVVSKAINLWESVLGSSKVLMTHGLSHRGYAKKKDDGCRRACADIPLEKDPVCPIPCDRRGKKKEGILHRIKLRLIDGGTNFGTPFRYLQDDKCVCKEIEVPEPKALPAPVEEKPCIQETRSGMQVAVLGADTSIGQYVALLLKQCPCIKKLRLYEARDTSTGCCRELCQVVHDLQHIDTNCLVQAYSCACHDLERCLQNSDIVLMLESGYLSMDMPMETRFNYQAPIVKKYADAIAKECPNAFILVCASPIDCMVPLVAETLKETGWYNPRKLLGSLAVPEMRASTLAARALSLEPCYVNVPCVGGTEGDALVPLFSKALEYFEFSEKNAEMMTNTVRCASEAVAKSDCNCVRSAELSEAHALAGLVTKVAWALLCRDVPQLSGFVETDPCQIISPARFLGVNVLLNNQGICKIVDLPGNFSPLELHLMDYAVMNLKFNEDLAMNWYCDYMNAEYQLGMMGKKTQFFNTKTKYPRVLECIKDMA
ncbi:unnamed protein product [Danaus chrysippus]|uniref:Malate dehydrogenase, mitochondrial n=1 Tax=Danaus chrysippus TaxID=151541 RepID=A0A8J2W256_9NEOP|nr:unnamed protein product [Danaus chrysippus]